MKRLLRLKFIALFFCTAIVINAQDAMLSGVVTDVYNVPLIGVNVVEKGTTNGTVTDYDGEFLFSAAPNSTIVFTYIGYQELEVVWDGKGPLIVTLQEDSELLDEVVVVGYGTQRKATVTGSISSVSGDELVSIPTTNFSNSLSGKIPGLVVLTRSGEPGSDASTLRIRGMNTLGDNSPLVVVDGISNRDLQRLDPNDIENITVLKDASAAIYGSKAANGVILLTTKRGVSGKPKVRFTYNEGRIAPTVLPNSLDAATYLEVLNEVNIYAGSTPPYSQEEIENYRNGTDPWLYPNTDWFAETLRSSSPQRNANISISGGQDYLRYFVSVGATYQDAIYKNSATNYNQMNFRVNMDGKINDYISYGVDISSLFQNRNYPVRSASTIFSMLRRGYPNIPAYWPNGAIGPDLDGGNNPVVITTNAGGYDKNKKNDLLLGANLDIKIPWVNGLSFTTNIAYDNSYNNDKLWQQPWYIYTWDKSTYDENGVPILTENKKGFTDPQLRQDFREARRFTLNGLLNYETKLGENQNLKLLVGAERISGNNASFWAFRKYFVSTALQELFAGGDAEKNNSGSSSLEERMNYFGRFNWDFKNKYLAEFVWRYDGSYIFPEDKRFGFFPGVSLGWVISDEAFFEGPRDYVNFLKLRASWGQTGNDRIDPYQYLSSFGFLTGSNIYVFDGDVESKQLQESRIGNPDVTWEVANQANIGFDSQFFGGKLYFSADYFHNLRTNILWNRNASVPNSTGLTLPRENIGEVINSGYEFLISYRDKVQDFGYNFSLNLNFNSNEIKFWDETPGVPEYQKSTGRPINAGLYYQAIGVFKDKAAVDSYPHWDGARPGDIIFEDVNKDGKIDGLDRVRSEKTDVPTHVGGLNIGLTYRGLYSNLFLQWATGAIRYDYYEFNGESGNYLVRDVEGRWTEDNPNSEKPRAWNRYFEYWRSNSNTYWAHSSDYLRLKNIEVGYMLPKNITENLLMEEIRVFFTGSNLLTFSKIKDFDPETTSQTAYPLNKVYNLGVSLTF